MKKVKYFNGIATIDVEPDTASVMLPHYSSELYAVTPPRFNKGQSVMAPSCGKLEAATVKDIHFSPVIVKEHRKRTLVYGWRYSITFNVSNVDVMRWQEDLRANASTPTP